MLVKDPSTANKGKRERKGERKVWKTVSGLLAGEGEVLLAILTSAAVRVGKETLV